MAQPYVGEIRLFAGNFAPAGWLFCDGQSLPIAEYETLFQLIGTTYGGDGESTFHLPDLRGRVPIHQGSGPGLTTRVPGETGGVEEVTLTVSQIPAHRHPVLVSGATGSADLPGGGVLAVPPALRAYGEPVGLTPLAPDSVGPAGGSQPHENRQPFLCVDFIISLFGIFPAPA